MRKSIYLLICFPKIIYCIMDISLPNILMLPDMLLRLAKAKSLTLMKYCVRRQHILSNRPEF